MLLRGIVCFAADRRGSRSGHGLEGSFLARPAIHTAGHFQSPDLLEIVKPVTGFKVQPRVWPTVAGSDPYSDAVTRAVAAQVDHTMQVVRQRFD